MSRALRVLIIEDVPDAAESMKVLVETLGHEAACAFDGETGLLAAASFRPDVIFLDLGLPGISGYDAAEAIRAQTVGAPIRIIALTGWAQDTYRARAAEVGIDEFLIKPVELAVLAEVLESAEPGTIESVVRALH